MKKSIRTLELEELTRLRNSHAVVLAAAKLTIKALDGLIAVENIGDPSGLEMTFSALKAAIAATEDSVP